MRFLLLVADAAVLLCVATPREAQQYRHKTIRVSSCAVFAPSLSKADVSARLKCSSANAVRFTAVGVSLGFTNHAFAIKREGKFSGAIHFLLCRSD